MAGKPAYPHMWGACCAPPWEAALSSRGIQTMAVAAAVVEQKSTGLRLCSGARLN